MTPIEKNILFLTNQIATKMSRPRIIQLLNNEGPLYSSGISYRHASTAELALRLAVICYRT